MGDGIQLLDAAAATTQADLRINIETPDALPAIRRRLYELGSKQRNSDDQRGIGTATLIFYLADNGCEVEMRLPGEFQTNVSLQGALKTIEGVSEVEIR